jgi:Ca2+/Na+ antiporter
MANWQTKLLGSFIPGYSAAFAALEGANKAVKSIFFLILVILAIVGLASSSGAASTSKGKAVLSLSVFIFIMTLGLFFKSKLQTNNKIIAFLVVYFVLALLATIIQYKNVDDLNDDKEKQNKAKSAARSFTGIVVIIGLYLLGGLILFNIAQYKTIAKEAYFLM